MGDLPLLATREELFAHKFHEDFHPETLDCLEEMLINRTLEEITGTLVFNDSYYRTRDWSLIKYSKTCVKWPLKNRQNKYLNDKW